MKPSNLFFLLALTFAANASYGSDSGTSSPPPAKSELIAYGLATGGTLIPYFAGVAFGEQSPYAANVLVFSGVLVGPSLGQFYAGSPWTASIGIATRTVGFVSLFVMNESDAILTFGLTWIAGTAYSFVDTHFAVQRANERARAKRTGASFDLYPTLSRTANGGIGAGMMARVGF